jgi:hypothetical protein
MVVRLLVRGLAAVATRLEPQKAADAVATLLLATGSIFNPLAPEDIERWLPGAVARLEPAEATRVATEIVARLKRASTEDPNKLKYLAMWVPAVAGRLEPGSAAEAAAVLARGLGFFKDDGVAARSLAHALAAVAGRMAPEAAAQVCSESVATVLARVVANSKAAHPMTAIYQAEAVAALAVRLKPADALRVCTTAAVALEEAIAGTTDPSVLKYRVLGLIAVGARLDSKGVSEAATALMRAMTREYVPDPNVQRVPEPVTDAFPALTNGLVAILRAGPPAAQKGDAGSHLSDQALVDLLKLPLCVGAARRTVLDQLGRRYHQTFTDQWAFLDFAAKHNLDLNFARLPQHP